jgi:CHAT domain-containing protein
LRADIVSDELQAEYFATQSAAYRELTALQLGNYAHTRDRIWLSGAFVAMERGRARALLDAVSARDPVPADPQARAAWRQLRSKALTQQRLQASAGEPDAEAIARLEREMNALRASIQQIERDDAPATQGVLGQPRTLAQVQAGLAPATMLLIYQLHDDTGWVWSIDANRADVNRIDQPVDLDDRVARLIAAIQDRSRDFTEEARALHAQLIDVAAIPAGTRRLVIVPDRELHRLPFSALIDAEGHYLIERYALTTLPSASLGIALRDVERPAARAADAAAVVFADPVFSGSDQRVAQSTGMRLVAAPPHAEFRNGQGSEPLARLPGTATEAAAIVRAFAPSQVTVFDGFEATVGAALGARAQHAQILHFATHGLVDAAAPESTGLALSRLMPDGATHGGDGILTLPMIQRTRYRASLVVLSACETVLGRRVDGEGLMGIARAFFAAGARGVLATLWAVPDQAMETLMSDFYLALVRDGMQPPEALQSAVRSALTRPRLRHPVNWAALTVFGLHWEPLRTHDSSGDDAGA